MTLGLGRDALVHIPTDDAYRMRVDALEAAIAADLAAGHRPIAIVATLGTTASTSADPIAPLAADRRAPRPVAPRRRRVRGRRRAAAGAPSRLRGLGARGLDRHQPAQVAVHAVRCLAPAEPAHARSPRRVQPRARVPPDARPRGSGPRRQRVHAPARAAQPGAQAVGPPALVRPRGPAPTAAPSPRPGPRRRRLGRRGPGLRAARADAVLGRLPPLAPGGAREPRWASPRSRRSSTSATSRSSRRSTGPARCSCPTRACTAGSSSGSRSGTFGRRTGTSGGAGSCSGERRRGWRSRAGAGGRRGAEPTTAEQPEPAVG